MFETVPYQSTSKIISRSKLLQKRVFLKLNQLYDVFLFIENKHIQRENILFASEHFFRPVYSTSCKVGQKESAKARISFPTLFRIRFLEKEDGNGKNFEIRRRETGNRNGKIVCSSSDRIGCLFVNFLFFYLFFYLRQCFCSLWIK